MMKLSSAALTIALASTASAQLAISIGVRENEAAGGAPFTAIGDNGGATGGIEWVNLDGQLLVLDGSWQLFTFNFATDPITAFAGSTATGAIDGTYGTLENIRIRNTGGQTGPVTLWIDDVDNTTSGPSATFGTFEGYPAPPPLTQAMFRQPSFSGSTTGIEAGSSTWVDNTVGFSGSASCKVEFEFSTEATTPYVRLTTNNVAVQGNPQIRFDNNATLSFWMRGLPGDLCEEFNPGPNVSTASTAAPFVGSNPTYRAWQFIASSTEVIESGEIYTAKVAGTGDDYCRLEIWDDIAGLPDPNSVLGSGTTFSRNPSPESWLGVNFDQLVAVTAGTPYWVVWVQNGAWRVPEDPTGTTLLPYANSGNSRTFTLRTPVAAKLRLYCNRLGGVGYSAIGDGCVNSLGKIGTLFTNEVPTANNTSFYIEGSGFGGMELAFYALGWDTTFASLPLDSTIGFPTGCFLHSSAEYGSAQGPMTGVAEIGQGSPPYPVPFGYIQFPLPLFNAVSGFSFTVQLVAFDSGSLAPLPAVSSNGIQITVQ